jgi:hypothetical protein
MRDLNKDTYFAYAMRMYDNPSCAGIDEFHEDLMRFKYIQRLLYKYVRTGRVRPQLLINHIIGVTNIFRPEAVSRILFFRVDSSAWRGLKTVLCYLNLMPEVIPAVNGSVILNSDISIDPVMYAQLKQKVDHHVI